MGAALLSDGSVVVVGGVDGGGDLPDDVLIVANAFVGTIEITPATVTVARRARPLVAVLPDDLVLIAGGAPANPTGRPDDESVLPRLDAEILVPIASTFLRFAPDNDLAQGRIDGASVVVGADGDEVLFLGGMATTPRVTPQPHAEKYELATNRFFSFGLMGPGTALTPGVVAGSGAALLSVGGIDPHGGRTSDIVRAFDAENGEFLLAGSLSSPRRDHTATSLAADLIVVIGGRDDSGAIIGSASVFNTVSGEDSPLPVGLARPRALHTATLLAPDNPHGAGAVLLCGGVGQGGEPLDTCEVFVPPSDLRDPLTYGSARFVFVGSRMATGRVGHSVTLLDTGEVLLVGGGDVENRQVRADLFVPDAVDPTLRPTGQPARARTGHAAVLMGGGHVLLVGGNTVDGSFGPTRTAEVYSRETEVFVEVEEMERPRSAPAAFLLADGQVLVSGGTRALGEPDYPFVSNVESELYSPGGDGVGTFELIDVPLSYGRSDLLAVEVFGRAIVAGGTHRDGTLVTGDERQTPQHFVDMLVDPTPDP